MFKFILSKYCENLIFHDFIFQFHNKNIQCLSVQIVFLKVDLVEVITGRHRGFVVGEFDNMGNPSLLQLLIVLLEVKISQEYVGQWLKHCNTSNAR